MKTLVVIAAAFFLSTPARAALDETRLVESIRQVENWRGGVGAAGERGPWQILPSLWRQYSAVDIRTATREEHERVARLHARWIVARLARLGLPATARSVGLVWNAGYGAVRRERIEPRHRDYADRVANIYSTLR